MTELDETDRKLLDLLRANSRTSTSELARSLGVSRSTVQDRINRLERRRIIAGYTIRYHPEYGGRRISAHVMIQINPKYGERIVNALREMSAVTMLQTVSGVYDLVTLVEATTTEALDRVLDRIGALPGVEKTTTAIVLTTKFRR
jgi:DNA-binding Lrp family transcriptional regulator